MFWFFLLSVLFFGLARTLDFVAFVVAVCALGVLLLLSFLLVAA